MPNTPARPLPGYREDQRDLFDRQVTAEWSTYSNPVWDASRRFEVGRLLRQVSARTVLDVGCGCGFHDVLIAEWPGVETVVGIDYSPASVDVAELHYPHPNVRRRVADILSEDRSEFDLVVSFQVIEHLRDQSGFLGACARQVRPGGHVAVATPNRLRLDNRIRRLLGREETLVDATHYRELSRDDLDAIASGVGLRPVASFGYGLQLTIPRLNRRLVPPRLGIRLGSLVPTVANTFCRVYERSR